MKNIFVLLIPLLFLGFHKPYLIKSYDIENIYIGEECDSDTKVLTSYGDLEDAETILVPSTIKAGKYVVKVSEKASNLYHIEDTELYVETSYCYETVFYEEVVLIIDNSYGITSGKLIFD
jgi:hypothetical protein